LSGQDHFLEEVVGHQCQQAGQWNDVATSGVMGQAEERVRFGLIVAGKAALNRAHETQFLF
jgi:hypothetical protein